MVGLYGDPSVTWSIMLECSVRKPVDAAGLEGRLAALPVAHPHLGEAPVLERVDPSGWDGLRDRFANTPYGDREPLVRLGLDIAGSQVMVAAHHGAVDGLGLVGLLNHFLGIEMTSEARGLTGTRPAEPFVLRAMRRLGEALVRPPARFRPARHERAARSGDWLVSSDVSGVTLSTARLVVATRAAHRHWGSDHDRRPAVVAVGASRRHTGEPLTPDRETAYLRLELPAHCSDQEVGEALASALPEPDFPATRGAGIGPLVTRLLSSRLGATALVSNLGRLSASEAAVSATFWPAASGPSGIAVGLVTVGERSTLSVRARRSDFTRLDSARILELVRLRLVEDQ